VSSPEGSASVTQSVRQFRVPHITGRFAPLQAVAFPRGHLRGGHEDE
jgi:hypothetical protein